MYITNKPELVQFGVGPIARTTWQGEDAPAGANYPWQWAPVGSEYIQVLSSSHTRHYRKVADNGRDDDWAIVNGVISERIGFAAFTDGGSTAGTLALANKIPQGAFVRQVTLLNVTGFTGDTSAVITLGDGSDVDRYNTGTPSVFANANAIDVGVPSGTKIHTADATVTVTVTSGSDWGKVEAGAATLRIWYTL